MTFTINKNFVFIDSMQFTNSSLHALVKNLSEMNFKYLSQEFSGEQLRLIKQKGVYPFQVICLQKAFKNLKNFLKINYLII